MKNPTLLTFRIFSCTNDDYEKTCVRIDKKHMQDLGIESGDIVKITGNRDTVAICLPLESKMQPSNTDFIFLDETSKNVPPIMLSNSVSFNVRGGNVGGLVQVSKATAVETTKVILATNKTWFPYDEKNLHLDKLDGLVIGKGDRVIVPHSDPAKGGPIFQVLDASPPGNFWTIDKNTKFEFAEISAEALHNMHVSKLDRLVNVIPVVKQISNKNFDLTFPSLEIYENATRFYFYMKDRVTNPREGIHAHPFPTIKVSDDLGNSYAVMDWQGHGGRQIGDGDFETEMSGMLVPTLDSKARELNFVIVEMVWQIMRMPGYVGTPKEDMKEMKFGHAKQAEMRPAEMTIEIASGPWEFKIPLKYV